MEIMTSKVLVPHDTSHMESRSEVRGKIPMQVNYLQSVVSTPSLQEVAVSCHAYRITSPALCGKEAL